MKAAVDADNEPVSLQVNINGELAGYYKGKSREHLERVIKYFMDQAKLESTLEVLEVVAEADAAETSTDAAAAADTALADATPIESSSSDGVTASADVSAH